MDGRFLPSNGLFVFVLSAAFYFQNTLFLRDVAPSHRSKHISHKTVEIVCLFIDLKLRKRFGFAKMDTICLWTKEFGN